MDKDLIIHYFLQNPTLHQLNARLVNNNQANIISIIDMISAELGIGIDIDVLAPKEGGLRDILRLKPQLIDGLYQRHFLLLSSQY